MAIRFCKGDANKFDLKKAIIFNENVFAEAHNIFLCNKDIEYVPLVNKDGNYICCCYDDKNIDDLYNKIYIFLNSDFGKNKVLKDFKNVTIVSFNEIAYLLYTRLSALGCKVNVIGDLWNYVNIFSIGQKKHSAIYIEGNNGLSLKELGHWKNTFPYNEYNYFTDNYTYALKNKLLYDRKLLSFKKCNKVLSKKIKEGKPLMVARLGNTEAIISNQYFNYYTKLWLKYLYTTSGFYSKKTFSDNIEDLFVKKDVDLYVEHTLNAIKNCDIHMCCFPNEIPLINSCCHNNNFYVDWYDLYTNFDRNSWIYALKGKKVLIISSFNNTIKFQYNNRKNIIKNFTYPELNLNFYDFPSTYLGNYNKKNDFFENYNKIISEISKIDFDVAIISAGAYGYLLASDIKNMGKQSIELCSGLYPLFGIKNKTQAIIFKVSSMYNEHWIFPIEEKPNNYMHLEKGAYWD